ncbi:protein translocase subunit SecD [Alphaproteobacteria bacterium]|nr:protein translocase subunit SecD [Alphaproteobacteria bacterium]
MQYLARWRVTLILGICFIGLWFGLQNFMPPHVLEKVPNFLPRSQLSLGLDLQGGSSVLFEVDLKDVVRDSLTSLMDEVRRVFRQKRIRYFNLKLDSKNTIRFKLRNLGDKDQVKELLLGRLSEVNISIDETGSVSITAKPSFIIEKEENAVAQSIEIIRRRIDEMGTKEPSIQKQGKDRILLQLPGMNNPTEVKNLLGKTAKLTFQLLHPTLTPENMRGRPAPLGYEIIEGVEGKDSSSYLVKKKVDISGEMLTNAGVDAQGEAKVTFSLDAIGARKFSDVTRSNIGRPFAIILDKKVVSAPVIESVIPSGRGVITGRFSLPEARNLAILLRAGALPAPLNILEEKTVGPELGSDSIKAGQIAIIIAVAAIFIFMFTFYGALFGTIANICLFFNFILLFSGLSLLGATLTLPGIAGIALTLGMAVDANILIYERIREEVRENMPPLSALGAGYNRAMGTIIDSNITTLIGAALLYQFGNGPVRGFSVTLSLGIIISMFTAIALSRLLVLIWLKIRGPQQSLLI